MGPDPHIPVEDRPGEAGNAWKDGDHVDALQELAWANRRLHQRIRHAATEIHDGVGPAPASRLVLRELWRGGPKTVPQMARARPVSRQHIQALVNGLLEESLVERRPNPAHKRSHLIAVTDAGRRLMERIESRERRVLRHLDRELDPDRIREAARVLEGVREALAGERWKSAVEAEELESPDG